MSVRPYPLLAACTAAALAAVVAVSRLERVVVHGASMRPALEPGDRLVVVRGLRPRPGDVVAAADPRAPERVLVKRVAAVGPGGDVRLTGDDPAASTDSRHFGLVDASLVRGRAVWRYLPAERRGRLPH